MRPGVSYGPPPEILRSALELYLDVHSHPELSGTETRTATALADRLRRQGCWVTSGVGGTGVVGVLRNGPGPTVLLRTELDALPLTEDTGLRYASTRPGVMHACGHDLHLAAVAGATAVLAGARERWRGTLLVVGQPAEETLDGARAMLRDGLYERFGVPDVVLAQHTAPLPAGTVAHGQGPLMAGSVSLEVVVHGSGGHPGTPQLTVDPVVLAAAIVLRLQTVVSREADPADQVVLTVGTLHAGDRVNVVPDSARLGISLRAHGERALTRALAGVQRVVRAECQAAGCPRDPDIQVTARSPVLACDGAPTASVRGEHQREFGPKRVLTDHPCLSATEDFPWYGPDGAELHGGTEVSTVYWLLGTTGARQWRAALERAEGGRPEIPAQHSPRFAPDVRTALPTGISAMAGAAARLLSVADG
ncbi:amidohydrolase [Streptomyces oceani]|uniref:Amidohydrolase n=1 Tax=Streptomyces oceani TaxID=1075402 RepID=A0A1E7KKF2_9ACTN|nr:amidohydrolase [Streptomyces oceani]OEV04347.1 amidohydrolase [Streptomyces oceani]